MERCGDVFQGKPIVVGVFLAHYWARNMKPGETDRLQHHHEWALRPMSHDILQAQLETSARLLEEGKIAGVSILAEALVGMFTLLTTKEIGCLYRRSSNSMTAPSMAHRRCLVKPRPRVRLRNQ